MKLLRALRSLFGSVPVDPPQPLSEWFTATFDSERIVLEAAPPGREPWRQELTWASITRVCFKTEDFRMSDGLYIFTTARPESYVVPVEGRGGSDLFHELIARKLFDANLAIEAASTTGKLFCWPPISE